MKKEQYFIVRCISAGVFFGQIKDRHGGSVIRQILDTWNE